jgi:hypothetical protein
LDGRQAEECSLAPRRQPLVQLRHDPFLLLQGDGVPNAALLGNVPHPPLADEQ